MNLPALAFGPFTVSAIGFGCTCVDTAARHGPSAERRTIGRATHIDPEILSGGELARSPA